jgi:hypothetical protein
MMGAAAVSFVAPAFADKPVQFSSALATPGNTADGAMGRGRTEVSAKVSNQVLILTFDQKVTINLDKLKEGRPTGPPSPSWTPMA